MNINDLGFELSYQKGIFSLKNSQLNPEMHEYLTTYLKQVSRYKIIGQHQGSPVFSLYQAPLLSQAGLRSLQYRLLRRFTNLRSPATATIAINKACQCECVHCSAVFYNHSLSKTLTSTQLIQAIDETLNLSATHIILLGGEPLLHPELEKIINSTDLERSVIILFTNGEFLTEEKCHALKKAGLMGAFVSLDCDNAAVHDENRKRPGLFNKAIEGLHNMKKAGLITGISSYFSPERVAVGAFTEMVNLAKKHDVDEITFFDAIPSGRWLKEESCILKESDRIKIQEDLLFYRKDPAAPGLSVQSSMTSECGSTYCFAANTQFYLNSTGEMCPCDFTPLSIGNYPEESITALWEKMIQTQPYDQRSKVCRMQDPDFRKKYIHKLPQDANFPYPLEKL